ncbi:MAG TPA: hypothetical protein VF158_07895 [Longimicrobiales bacterium]
MDPTREASGRTGPAGGAVAALDGATGRDARPAPDPGAAEREIRGRLYQELDLLAFALEMEAAEAVERGDDDEAARAQRTRLGVRLAQRLVGAVPAPEVDRRLERWRAVYQAKFPR